MERFRIRKAACFLITLFGLFIVGPAFSLPSPENPYLQGTGLILTTPFAESSESLGDNEGSALVLADNSLWLVDDSREILVEVDVNNGSLKRIISSAQLQATTELGGSAPAGVARTGDLEAIAYDPIADELFVFSGGCCNSASVTPAVFRLTRQGGRLELDSFSDLPSGSDFSGAAANPLTGQLWVASSKTVSAYTYGAFSVTDSRSYAVSGVISGLGFTPDGNELLMVSTQERLYRLDWATRNFVPGYDISIPLVGDSRSVVVLGDEILIGDGWDAASGTSSFLAVHRMELSAGVPPSFILNSPFPGEIQLDTLEVSGVATDDTSVESVAVIVRSRDTSEYLRPGGLYGRPYRFPANLSQPSSPSTDFSWSTDLPPGDYSVQVEVRDNNNLLFSMRSTRFTMSSSSVAVDTEPPTSTVTSPSNAESVLSPVTISGFASDNQAVASMRVILRDRATGRYLQADGTFGRARYLTIPVVSPGVQNTAFSWAPPGLGEGQYFVDVQARDEAGNLGVRDRIYFDVVSVIDNELPSSTVTAPTDGESVLAPVVIAGSAADDQGVASMRVILRNRETSQYLQDDGSFGRANYITVPVASPGATNTTFSWAPPGLVEGQYFVDVQARDAAGNLGDRERIYFDVVSVIDTIPPSSSVSTPANGETVLAPVSISGTAADDQGVASMRVILRNRETSQYLQDDGSFGRANYITIPVASSGATNTTFTWVPPGLGAGSYFVDVQARDLAGNLGVRDRIYFDVVTVIDNEPPSSTVSSPTNGENVLAPVLIEGIATDDQGVASMRVILRNRATSQYLQDDGSFGRANYITVPVASPGAGTTAFAWAPPGLGVGSYFVDVQARDGVGNLGVRERIYFDVVSP